MMLVLGIFLPYIRTITALMDDVLGADFTALEESLKIQPTVNLFIVVFCLIFTFRTSIETIAESFGYNKPASKK